ncbi:eukaryotic translation initiation factor 3 subunit A-like [Galleria mellonella]|uniref:Eukaryotic translation initiation factor 3 subunit A-like n=1 Tax=Galleria mellonella TaxID=7137 RepID=A0A6J1WS85_GALME|nr:eukaryotic translation initiation factor 3 subunit A-like [Galleria mellonella]
MEVQRDKTDVQNVRLQNVLETLSKCKIDYLNDKEECKKLRETNLKIELELKEARELEKSHRHHLLASRQMIENLQETVSQLVYLKRDIKKLSDEIALKDATITSMEKDKENILLKHNEKLAAIHDVHQKEIEEILSNNEKKIEQVQHECDTQIAQFTCVIEELRCKMKDMEVEHRDKMNVVVLEYEEKIQRGAAQVDQLQEQLARQAARTESSLDVYRQKLEELEEKLKQSQFKQYLAQNPYSSQFVSQVERPYSANRDPYPQNLDMDAVFDSQRVTKSHFAISNQNKQLKPTSSLQVIYYGNKTPNKKSEKKGQFNITKKRKLYNEKDFQDF